MVEVELPGGITLTILAAAAVSHYLGYTDVASALLWIAVGVIVLLLGIVALVLLVVVIGIVIGGVVYVVDRLFGY